MTTEDRRLCKEWLWHMSALPVPGDPDSERWAAAIQKTIDYYQGQNPIRSGLIELRYRSHTTEEATLAALRIGRTTFQKANVDVLSTLAVYAAKAGLL